MHYQLELIFVRKQMLRGVWKVQKRRRETKQSTVKERELLKRVEASDKVNQRSIKQCLDKLEALNSTFQRLESSLQRFDRRLNVVEKDVTSLLKEKSLLPKGGFYL